MAINYNHIEDKKIIVQKYHFFLDGLIGFGQDLAGLIGGEGTREEKNYNLQADAYQYNKEWNQQTFDEDVRRYEETKLREDNAMQRAVADAKAAGMNVASLTGSVGAGGASGSTPTQANMLEAPQHNTNKEFNPMEALQVAQGFTQLAKQREELKGIKTENERKEGELELFKDTKEWKKLEVEGNAKKSFQTALGQEIANRIAQACEQNNIDINQIQKDILEIEKTIKSNEKELSERQKKQIETLGILPTDSPDIIASKLRAIYSNLKNYDGDTQNFIKAYAAEWNEKKKNDLVQQFSQIIGGGGGWLIRQLNSLVGNYEHEDLDKYRFNW